MGFGLTFCNVNRFSAFCYSVFWAWLGWSQFFPLWCERIPSCAKHFFWGCLEPNHHFKVKVVISFETSFKNPSEGTKIAQKSFQDPFKRGSGSLSWEQLIFWGCPERNHHSGPKVVISFESESMSKSYQKVRDGRVCQKIRQVFR